MGALSTTAKKVMRQSRRLRAAGVHMGGGRFAEWIEDDADDAERQFAEIPPDILARILATERVGRQRGGLA